MHSASHGGQMYTLTARTPGPRVTPAAMTAFEDKVMQLKLYPTLSAGLLTLRLAPPQPWHWTRQTPHHACCLLTLSLSTAHDTVILPLYLLYPHRLVTPSCCLPTLSPVHDTVTVIHPPFLLYPHRLCQPLLLSTRPVPVPAHDAVPYINCAACIPCTGCQLC